jgi:hypothetical protein
MEGKPSWQPGGQLACQENLCIWCKVMVK